MYKHTTWGSLDKVIPQAQEIIKNYIENFPHNNCLGLYIYSSEIGSGKTSLMWLIIQDILKLNKIAKEYVFMNINDFSDELREDYMHSDIPFYKKVKRCELLMLDDFGRKKQRDFFQERLFSILDTRIKNDLPTIFSSHIPLEGSLWITDMEQAIFSRIKNNCEYVRISQEKE